MKKKVLLSLVVGLALGNATAFASAQGWDVRAMGMGSAFIAVADDINTVDINSAGLGFIKSPQAELAHLSGSDSGLTNYSLNGLEYVTPVGNGAIGGSYTHQSFDNNFNYGKGYYDNYSNTYNCYSLAYGVEISKGLAVGIHIAQENLTNKDSYNLGTNAKGSDSSTATNTDVSFSALYRDPVNTKWSYGVVMGNSDYNTGFTPGVAYRCDNKTLVAVDFDSDTTNFGVEHHLNNKWIVRVGSNGGDFTYGAGYKFTKDLRLDYAHENSLNALAISSEF
jgi:hypothetical protein